MKARNLEMVGLSRERESAFSDGRAVERRTFSVWRQTGKVRIVMAVRVRPELSLKVKAMRR